MTMKTTLALTPVFALTVAAVGALGSGCCRGVDPELVDKTLRVELAEPAPLEEVDEAPAPQRKLCGAEVVAVGER
jgi:hypothetical protein